VLNIKKLSRAAKGIATPDEMMELLGSLGMEMETRALTSEDAIDIARAARAPGAKRIFVRGKMGGDEMLAMMILPGDAEPASLPN
jgi:hypothetical protein